MAVPSQLRQTLEMARGESKGWAFQVLQNGSALNITGCTATFTAKRSIADADPLISKSQVDGITIDGGTDGTGSLMLSPSDTSGLEDARVTLAFSLEVVLGGNTYVPAAGNLLIYPFTQP